MGNYKRFNFVLLATIFSPLLAIGLFNIVIDPYGVMNTPSFIGVNQLKIAQPRHVRLFKAVAITRIKPTTVLLGTSRAEFLDTKHPALGKNTKGYNLGLPGANMYEVRRYFEHTLSNQQNLKEVVLEISLMMFDSQRKNRVDFSEKRLKKKQILEEDALKIIFSLDALEASLKTINFNSNQTTVTNYYSDGGRNPEAVGKTDMLLEFKDVIQEAIQKKSKKIQLSEQYINDFVTIVHTCKQRNINLKVFISPVHTTEMEEFRTAGLWPVFEDWKRRVSKVTPLWDFSGYNSITREPITKDMKNFTDRGHYTRKIGDLILNRLFHYQEEKVPNDFGILITPTNIESHLAKIRTDQELWAKNNPKMIQIIEELKSQVCSKNSCLENAVK